MNLNRGDYCVLTYLGKEKFLVYIREISDGVAHASVCSKSVWIPWFHSLTPYEYSQPVTCYQTATKYEPTKLEKFLGLVRSKKLFGEST